MEAICEDGSILGGCMQKVNFYFLPIDPITVSKQGKRLLYIMQAPQLKRPTEWMTQIPDLAAIADNENQTRIGSGNNKPKQIQQPEPVDLSQVNTQDNRFIWVSLIAISLTLLGLLWNA